jgi:glucose-inhibited division protein A
MSVTYCYVKPCNPAVGGPAKSQLVHEVDALGGDIGKVADRCYLQKRILNVSRGPAVRSLRAQTDKREYATEMKKIVDRSAEVYFLLTCIFGQYNFQAGVRC